MKIMFIINLMRNINKINNSINRASGTKNFLLCEFITNSPPANETKKATIYFQGNLHKAVKHLTNLTILCRVLDLVF
jgi:hypothetical protein